MFEIVYAMVDSKDIVDIAPYSDKEAIEALSHVARHPLVPAISKYIFPDLPENFLGETLSHIHSIDQFQSIVMSKAVVWVLDNTVKNFSYDGFLNVMEVRGKFLALSNHRDIILDPALTQYILWQNSYPQTEICVGDNLISSSKTIEYLLRSNRMIKVIRGISARELYLSSKNLSEYIRQTITSGRSSIWLAQRQGRTKNGLDTTEQGLLKMLDMSGTGSFTDNFDELNIVPLSISYEYEPCDIRKAREILISRTQKYVKTETEDLESILTGITQWKGNVHMNFGKPLSREEIDAASDGIRNDRYQSIRHAVDKRVIEGYKLWKTNYICYDLVNKSFTYVDQYTQEDVEAFTDYMEKQLDTVEKELNRDELRDVFLRIYANPVAAKASLTASCEHRAEGTGN